VTDYEWIFSNRLADDKDEKKIRSITKEPTKITCDRMQYSEETGVAAFFANSGGTVRFDQTQRVITGSYLEVNDKTKDFYVEGTSEAAAKYEQTDGRWLYEAGLISGDKTSADLNKALEGQITANARSITFNYDRKRIEMREGVTITAASKTITANELVQDDTAKYFLLNGNVVVKPDDASEIHAAQIYVDTDKDIFTFVGLVQGNFKSDDVSGLVPDQAAGAGAGGVSGTPGGQPGTGPAAGIFLQPPVQRQVSDSDKDTKNGGSNVAEGKR
jgi:lipopolysaccharide assembly outer membrane protein LptD (OstA)